MRLDRYIISTVIGGALVALVVVLSLMMAFEFIEEAADAQAGLTAVLLEVLLTTPQRAYELFPMTTLIGALVGLGALASRHELVAMRGAGFSLLAVTRAVLVAGVLLGLAAVALGEWVAPPAQKLAQQWRAEVEQGAVARGPEGGFWVRDGERFMHIERAPSRDVIEGVTAYTVRGDRLVRRVSARRGIWDDGAWLLQDVAITRPTQARIETSSQQELRLSSDVPPATLEVVVLSPKSLPLADLYNYIQHLEGSGLDSGQYRLAFWMKVTTPLATLTMLLITVPLIFGALGSVGTGQKIFVGVLIGIAFFLVHRLLANAGLVYGIPPALCALAPTGVIFSLGLWGLWRLR